MKSYQSVLAVLVLATSVKPLMALNTLTAGELADSCLDEQGAVTAICSSYVRGFVDGALATDPRVAMNVEAELSRAESFADRAYRTRLGQSMDRFGPSFYADFCIPSPVPIQEIVALVKSELDDISDRGESARELVYRSLRKGFPCTATD